MFNDCRCHLEATYAQREAILTMIDNVIQWFAYFR